MVDSTLHKQTQYRIPRLCEQFKEIKSGVTNYIWLGGNWDSYNAKKITFKTIERSVEVLRILQSWFEDNIGFLNNRSLSIDVTPCVDGNVHIEFDYNNEFMCDIFVGQMCEFNFGIKPRNIHNNETIADRHVNSYFPKKENAKFKIISKQKIESFLTNMFYNIKWKDEIKNA